MSELTESNPVESGYADEDEYRKNPHHGTPLSLFLPAPQLVHLLGRVRGLGAGVGLGAVLSLPPSLLLDHDSDRGYQT